MKRKRLNRFDIVAYSPDGARLAWETTHHRHAMSLTEFAAALAEIAKTVKTMADIEAKRNETVAEVLS